MLPSQPCVLVVNTFHLPQRLGVDRNPDHIIAANKGDLSQFPIAVGCAVCPIRAIGKEDSTNPRHRLRNNCASSEATTTENPHIRRIVG